MHVEHVDGVERGTAREGTLVRAGERVRYSTPVAAEYLALCVPASRARRRPDFGARLSGAALSWAPVAAAAKRLVIGLDSAEPSLVEAR